VLYSLRSDFLIMGALFISATFSGGITTPWVGFDRSKDGVPVSTAYEGENVTSAPAVPKNARREKPFRMTSSVET